MARKRAQQRWSALLTRIAKQVRPALGDMLWDNSSRTPSRIVKTLYMYYVASPQ